MKVFVLEHNRLGKGYVIDHKTLDVYETERIEDNEIYVRDHNRNDILSICCCIISVLWFYIIRWILNLIGLNPNMLISYLTLIAFMFFYTKVFSPFLIVDMDLSCLKPISKKQNNILINNMAKNALAYNKRNYDGGVVALIFAIIFICIILCRGDYSYFPPVFTCLIWFALMIFHNRLITRKRTLKKLIKELEQR